MTTSVYSSGPALKISKKLVGQIKKLKRDGHTHEEVGNQLGLSIYETSLLFKTLKEEGFDVPTLRKGRGLSKEKVNQEKVIDGYQKGFSSSELAEQFNCSKQHITYILKAADVEIRGRQPEIDYQRVYDLIDEGNSKVEVAKQMGCNPWTIYSILKKRKRRGRPKVSTPRGPKRSLDYDKIQNLYQEGFSGRQIAQKLGCSSSHVYRILSPLIQK